MFSQLLEKFSSD